MRTKTLWYALVMVAVATAPGIATADETTAEETPEVVQRFDTWDLDDSGELERREWNRGFGGTTLRDDWDVDADKYIASEEMAESTMKVWDADRDRRISGDEFRDANMGWWDEDSFEDWDADGDDYLDEDEWRTGFADLDLWEEWDADVDSRLNETELRDGLYDSYDRNDDGVISEWEWDDSFWR